MSTESKLSTHYGTTVTEEDIEQFAELSGDRNPLHLKEAAAQDSRFNGRIAHGMLVTSYVSAALSKLPCEVILLSTNFTYEEPVRPGDAIYVEVKESWTNGEQYTFNVTVKARAGKGDEVVTGEATVLLD